MQVLTKSELEARKEFFLRKLTDCIFIYPTDTIYGVGCNALDGRLVDRIRELKGRYNMPFSVIAPSKEWIREYCVIDEEGEKWLAKLPGPYTLIFQIKKHEEFPRSITMGKETLGVRIPDHWIAELATELNFPIITTSANRTGGNHMQQINDLPIDWKDEVAYVLYDGELVGTPSTLIHLYKEKVLVQER